MDVNVSQTDTLVSMKIALVHELLTMRGGAERMLRVVADMFPDAPIYTLLYDEKKLGAWFPKERVRTSSVQNIAACWPLPAARFNHHLHLRKFPQAVEQWPFDSAQGDTDFDLVISFSSAFAHGIKTRGMTKHLCYVHTPARYLWDQTFDVLDRAERGFLGSLKRRYLEGTFHKLRQWDARTSERPDKILAASKAVQRRIELYWRRESEVLYPPVDIAAFPLFEGKREDYFVIASTLVAYKRIELAIEACNKGKKKLKIVGEGPHRKALEKIAGPTIEFLGYKEHSELVSLLQRASAFLFPGEEDFGIAPVEAMACGTPVIAYRGGGALETVLEGKTGEFFSEPNADSLLQILQKFACGPKHDLSTDLSSEASAKEEASAKAEVRRFEQKSYSNNLCAEHAKNFSQKDFLKNLSEIIRRM